MKQILLKPVLSIALLGLAGCASVPERNPLPESLSEEATVLGSPYMRHWGDEASEWIEAWDKTAEKEIQQTYPEIAGREHHYLAISGGGEKGAYGAGLLCGWSKTGKRPEFTIVTGISTGGITAPFAFLGPKYDEALKKVYTEYSTEDLVTVRKWWNLIGNHSFTDTAKLEGIIARYVNEEMLAELAAEHKKGRQR